MPVSRKIGIAGERTAWVRIHGFFGPGEFDFKRQIQKTNSGGTFQKFFRFDFVRTAYICVLLEPNRKIIQQLGAAGSCKLKKNL